MMEDDSFPDPKIPEGFSIVERITHLVNSCSSPHQFFTSVEPGRVDKFMPPRTTTPKSSTLLVKSNQKKFHARNVGLQTFFQYFITRKDKFVNPTRLGGLYGCGIRLSDAYAPIFTERIKS